ncbi:hypothetical protein EJB05_07988, partial [Eragrostis curvula]
MAGETSKSSQAPLLSGVEETIMDSKMQQAVEADSGQKRNCRLDLPDLVYSGAVCTSWHQSYSAVRRFRLCSPDQSPYLVFSSADQDSNTATLHNVSTNKIYHASLPDPPFRSRYIVGSSQGWLVTADELSNLHLLNPISGAQIALPLPQSIKDVTPSFTEDGDLAGYYIMAINNGRPAPDFYPAKEARHYLYDKVVLSSDPSCGECTVLLKHRPYQYLSFAKIGDNKWTWLAMECCRFYHDIFYNDSDGLFYAIRSCGDIHTIDLTSSPPAVEVVFRIVHRNVTQTSYVLRAPWGDLLMILSTNEPRFLYTTDEESGPSSDDEENYVPRSYLSRRAKVTVHKVNLAKKKVTRVKNLQDHALFLGFNHAFMLNAHNHANLSPNCAYFSDDDNDHIYCYPFAERHLVRLNLKDATLTDLSFTNSLLNWPPPVWFRPRLS